MDTMIKTGEEAPDFELPDLGGEPHRLSDWLGQLVILNFWSAECPWAKRGDHKLIELLHKWEGVVQLCSIASNINETRALLLKVATERRLPLVLVDQANRVADMYLAQTTPHVFVIDKKGILRYQGAIDDITFRQKEATRNYLQGAIAAMVAGHQPNPDRTDPYGCAIVRTV